MTKRKVGRKGGNPMTQQIIALGDLGTSPKDIAAELGCTPGHVSNVLYKHRTGAMTNKHSPFEHWQAPDRPTSCREWVQTPEGLRPCGQPKHKIDGEVKGQCSEHYEKQRPYAGKTITKAA